MTGQAIGLLLRAGMQKNKKQCEKVYDPCFIGLRVIRYLYYLVYHSTRLPEGITIRLSHTYIVNRPFAHSVLRRSVICILILFNTELTFISNVWAKQSDSANNQSAAVLLEPDKLVEKEISPGQSQRYRIPVDTGQYIRINAEQIGIDFNLNVYRPDSHLLVEMNGPYGNGGRESVSLISEASEDYVIELRASSSALVSGRYRLTVEGPRPPSQADLIYVAAQESFIEGQNFSKDPDKQIWPQAIPKYEEALNRYREAADRYEEAKVLCSLGRLYQRLQKIKDALTFYNHALNIIKQTSGSREKAFILGQIGFAYLRSDPTRAKEPLTQSLALYRDENDKVGEARLINNLGGFYELLGDAEQAMEHYRNAFVLRQELKDWSGATSSLNNVGMMHDIGGNAEEALNYYNKVITLVNDEKLTDEGSKKALGSALNNLGYTYVALGEPERALEYFNQALPLRIESNDPVGHISTLLNMGNVYLSLGDSTKALEYYERAHRISEEIADEGEIAYSLMYKGQVYSTLRNWPKALAQFDPALDVFRKRGDRQGEAAVLNEIAAASAAQGNSQEAISKYTEALSVWRAIKDIRGEAASLYGMARAEKARGNLAEAQIRVSEAVRIVESLRLKVISQNLRASYLARTKDYYDLNVDLLMQLHKARPTEGYSEIALRVSEQARARSLLDSIAEIGKNIREGADPKLLEQEKLLQRQIESKSQRQTQLLVEIRNDPDKKPAKDQLSLIEKDLNSLLIQQRDLLEKIRSQSPRYAALTRPQPLSLKEIQQQVLDPETVLLEYALGEDRSYLWLITQSEFKSFELPKRSEIEASARQAHNLISTNKAIFDIQPYWKEAAKLSQMLLGQAAPYLTGKRLIIVSEGALQYVSFASLPLPGSVAGRPARIAARPSILLERFEVVPLPSASIMAVMRHQFANRKKAGKMIVAFANPVFSNEDQRVNSLAKGEKSQYQQAKNPNLERVLRNFDPSGNRYAFYPLEHSREEAEIIASLVEPENMKMYLNFEANKSNAQSNTLSDYRIIHFATHGMLNSLHPDASCMVLSLVNEKGELQDGFLRLNDIYNLKLNADLVVLSACETALGKDVKGEGLIGLTRGFMYAGAARVVASLWKVDDAKTGSLMKRFYEKMIKKSMEPSAALRAAQLEMWQGMNISPYYWAAFTLQGEWRNQ